MVQRHYFAWIHLPSCLLHRWGCCTRGSCPCDAGIPSSGSTVPRWKTFQSFLPVDKWVWFVWDRHRTLVCTPQRQETVQVHTLFHSLSSLGSSKVSPSFTSWSFRELLSTDRVSLFPSIPYLARITAQPNTDALAIDYPDSLVKGTGLTLSCEDAPDGQSKVTLTQTYSIHFNVIWRDLTLKITQRSNRQQLIYSEHQAILKINWRG